LLTSSLRYTELPRSSRSDRPVFTTTLDATSNQMFVDSKQGGGFVTGPTDAAGKAPWLAGGRSGLAHLPRHPLNNDNSVFTRELVDVAAFPKIGPATRRASHTILVLGPDGTEVARVEYEMAPAGEELAKAAWQTVSELSDIDMRKGSAKKTTDKVGDPMVLNGYTKPYKQWNLHPMQLETGEWVTCNVSAHCPTAPPPPRS